MPSLLCTIGFAGKTAEEFFQLLNGAGVQQLIDVRLNRDGQLSGFAKYPDLAYFLDRVAQIPYSHEPQLAPTPELLKSYRDDGDWAGYEAAFLELMRSRGVPEAVRTSNWPATIALLCSEPGPERCHRRLVADLLAEYWQAQGQAIEIRHLVAARRAKLTRGSKEKI